MIVEVGKVASPRHWKCKEIRKGCKGSIVKNKAILDGESVAEKILKRVVSNSSRLNSWPAYLSTVVVTLATFEVRMALAGQLGSEPTLVIFTVPIMLSAYFGGLRAGLLSTAISYSLASYYLLPPHHSFLVTTSAQGWNIIFVVLAGVLISGLNGALHLARQRADVAIQERAELITANARRELNDLRVAIDAHAIVASTDTKGRISYVNILMDIPLPGIDGLALTRLLKASERTRHLRVGAVTAFAMNGDDARAFAAGYDDYITKSTDTRRFPAQVAALLECHPPRL